MRGSLAILSFVASAAGQGIEVYSGKADGLSQHTIYMPKTSGKVPVLVWGSGGCMRDGGSQHGPALREAAAHGVMIISMGNLGKGKMGGFGGMGKMGGKGGLGKMGGKGKGGGLARRQLGKGKGAMGGMGSDTRLHDEAFKWIEQNAGKGKYANVDKSRVAVAGQSCGGVESYNVAKNPLVKVIGIFNSGMFATSPLVTNLRKPVFYFLGGSSDIAYKNGERDFKELPKTTPTWKGNLPVGHMATYMQAKGGKFGTAMWKWLDWTLRGNSNSSTFFTGDGPGSAKADGWSVERRALNGIKVTPI